MAANNETAYLSYLLDNNPQVRSVLYAIRKSEGADYDTMFGGGKMTDLSKHPNKRIPFTNKKGDTEYSTAAGAYQFLKPTYDRISKKLGITDMQPRSQDLMALALIKERGALNDIIGGDIYKAVNKLGREWASLPSSAYKSTQPSRTWKQFETYLQQPVVMSAEAGTPVQAAQDRADPIKVMQAMQALAELSGQQQDTQLQQPMFDPSVDMRVALPDMTSITQTDQPPQQLNADPLSAMSDMARMAANTPIAQALYTPQYTPSEAAVSATETLRALADQATLRNIDAEAEAVRQDAIARLTGQPAQQSMQLPPELLQAISDSVGA